MAAASAYTDALAMLARRELSEAQVRQRLARKGHDPVAIADAVERLRDARALDDARVAEAIARTDTAVHRRGKWRVKRHIEQAGIAAATAERIVNEVFASVDADALLEAALERRLRGRTRIDGEAELARLYRQLVAQGFESDQVLAALKRKRRGIE